MNAEKAIKAIRQAGVKKAEASTTAIIKEGINKLNNLYVCM